MKLEHTCATGDVFAGWTSANEIAKRCAAPAGRLHEAMAAVRTACGESEPLCRADFGLADIGEALAVDSDLDLTLQGAALLASRSPASTARSREASLFSPCVEPNSLDAASASKDIAWTKRSRKRSLCAAETP